MREKVQEGLPRRGYTVERAGLMSAAKSTLSERRSPQNATPLGVVLFLTPRAISPFIFVFVTM